MKPVRTAKKGGGGEGRKGNNQSKKGTAAEGQGGKGYYSDAIFQGGSFQWARLKGKNTIILAKETEGREDSRENTGGLWGEGQECNSGKEPLTEKEQKKRMGKKMF